MQLDLFSRFAGDLACNEPAPNITALKLGSLKFRELTGPNEHLPARHMIDDILLRANLSNNTIANSPIYPAWEIEEILASELVR